MSCKPGCGGAVRGLKCGLAVHTSVHTFVRTLSGSPQRTPLNWDRPASTNNWPESTRWPSIRRVVALTTVEPLDGYKLRLIFDDGSQRVVDLTADLWGPMGEPLRDAAVFRQVRVDPELRTIVWPNGFDLDPDVLHGRSSQDVSPAAPEQPAG